MTKKELIMMLLNHSAPMDAEVLVPSINYSENGLREPHIRSDTVVEECWEEYDRTYDCDSYECEKTVYWYEHHDKETDRFKNKRQVLVL